MSGWHARALWLLDGHTQNPRGGAGIRLALCAEAPGNFVVCGWPRNGPVAFILVAWAAATRGAAAAVVVGNDVVPLVRGILARTDPRNR